MPKDTKTLGNNKARACESLGFVHKKRLCQRFDTTSLNYTLSCIKSCINQCLQVQIVTPDNPRRSTCRTCQ